jgi:hypothetical protein
MPSRRFPKPWSAEPMTNGYRVIDANAIVLAHVYGSLMAPVPIRINGWPHDVVRRISKLIARLPEFVELEKDQNRGYHPIWVPSDARVPGVAGRYPDFNKH